MRTLTGPQSLTAKEALSIIADRLFDTPDASGSDRAKVLTGTWADSVHNGQKSVAASGTAEPLVGSSTPLREGVRIKAHDANTGIVYVGDSSVSASNGFEISKGDDDLVIPVDDLAEVYIDAATSGEGISFIAS